MVINTLIVVGNRTHTIVVIWNDTSDDRNCMTDQNTNFVNLKIEVLSLHGNLHLCNYLRCNYSLYGLE